jgi:hypothetical protein
MMLKMPKEVALQQDMFSGELIDNRTESSDQILCARASEAAHRRKFSNYLLIIIMPVC